MARRVLYLDEAYGFGGSTSCLLGLVEHLDPTRYEGIVVVAYPFDALKGRGKGLRLMSLPLRPAGLPPLERQQGLVPARLRFLQRLIGDVLPRALALSRLGKRENAALVHVNNNLRLNLAGILAARFLRVPCVAHIRNFERINALSRWGFRQVVRCIAMSEAVKAHMIREGLDRRKIVRVYNGLTARELNGRYDGTSVRRGLGLPSGKPTYGLVGMLVRWKGHKLFLEAASRIRREVPEALGLVVGDTPIPDDPYRRELEGYAQRLGLNGHVRFIGFLEDPRTAFAALDVVVHASTAPEPFGRVLIEAMALGRPIVAPAAGGPLEIVVPAETGLLFPPGDARALADQVVNLLKDPALRKRLGDAARHRVLEVFRAEKEAEQVQLLYDQVLRTPR